MVDIGLVEGGLLLVVYRVAGLLWRCSEMLPGDFSFFPFLSLLVRTVKVVLSDIFFLKIK